MNKGPLSRDFPKEDLQIVKRYIKKCSASLIIRGMQINIQGDTVLYLLGRLSSKTQVVTSVGEGEEKATLVSVGRNINWYGHMENMFQFKTELSYDPENPVL